MKNRFTRIPKRRWVSHKGERLIRFLKKEVNSSSEWVNKRRTLGFISQSYNVRAKKRSQRSCGPLLLLHR